VDVRLTGRKERQLLFACRRDSMRGLTTRQYARLVREWVGSIGSRSTLGVPGRGRDDRAVLKFTPLASGWPGPGWFSNLSRI
jgi:hypothetical protein